MSVQTDRAWRRARNLYTSHGFQTAYVKGATAALQGRTQDVCPYRVRHGWGNPWRAAWLRGYRSVSLAR